MSKSSFLKKIVKHHILKSFFIHQIVQKIKNKQPRKKIIIKPKFIFGEKLKFSICTNCKKLLSAKFISKIKARIKAMINANIALNIN